MKIRANNISIEIEDTSGNGTPVLLIMGLGMQLISWPPALVRPLVEAGYRVIRMDNRDIGLSQHFDHLGAPNLVWAAFKQKMGMQITPPYTLHDMAQDAIGVLESLGLAQAHIVGASMGGMIAQRVALAAPERTLSLTSIMSSSGAPGLPAPSAAVMRALLSRPASPQEAAVVAHYVRLFGIIGSPAYPTDPQVLEAAILAGMRRSFHPVGTSRQMLAIAADATRSVELSAITRPTLVLHGKADPLVPFACGQDTAKRIPGAQLHGIEGMGHDLPIGVITQLLPPMLSFFAKNNPGVTHPEPSVDQASL